MKNTKKTLWIKSAAIMLAISAIFLLDANAKGPGSGGGGGGMSIYEGDPPMEADCRACHDELGNPDRHHAAVLLCDVSEVEGCSDCVDCHWLVLDDPEAIVVSHPDCFVCHPVYTIVGGPGASFTNVHHQTDLYYDNDCFACHQN